MSTFLNWVSAIGSIASLIGIVITIQQMRSVKAISESTRNDLNRTIIVTEISKCNELIKEIILLLKQNSFEISLMKMREVKDMIIKLKTLLPQFKIKEIEINFHSNITGHINALSESIHSIEDNYTTPRLLNSTHISRKMDDLSSYIVEIQAHMSNRITP